MTATSKPWTTRLATHRALLLAITLLVLGSILLTAAGTTRAKPADPVETALSHVAEREGIPLDALIVVESGEAHLPLTNVQLTELKVEAPDGRIFTISVDQATGEVIDANNAAEREREQRRVTFGAVAPGLAQRSNAAGGNDRIPVAIWVAMEDPGNAGRRADGSMADLMRKVSEAQAPVEKTALGFGIGAQLRKADLVPVIFAELTPGQINGLAHNPHILAIEEIPQNIGNLNEDAATSERFTYAWPYARGKGAKVAVHEDDGVDKVNSWLVDPVYWCSSAGVGPGGAACVNGKHIGDHATNVAGVIAATHPFRRGGAWGIEPGGLLSANFQSYTDPLAIVNSASWALGRGADTLNMSWGGCWDGTQSFYSRWVDYLVKTFGDSVVVSSGNRQCADGYDPDYVTTPSTGWNTISVGSYYDLDTGLRSDDVLSSFSSFRNPTDPNTGRTYEKPDVVGMGGESDWWGCYGVETTSVGGGVWDSTCGTSFAAPEVTALTALVVGKDANLRNKAETVKAIVMAGATNNVVDGAGYTRCPTAPIANDCRDGAGAIDAWQTIANVVTPGNWRHHDGVTSTSFDARGYISYTIPLKANVPIRAVIAWDSTAVCANLGKSAQDCTSDVLNADLDLQLLSPAGKVVARSASLQNSAEVIDYRPTANGTYTLRIRRSSFAAGTDTNVGLAWNLDTRDRVNPLTKVGSFALNTTKLNQTTDRGRSYWDSYVGTDCGDLYGAETGLEKVYRVTTTQPGTLTATITNQRPTNPDAYGDLDVILLRHSGPANNLNQQAVKCGWWNDNYDDEVRVTGLQPGTYYIVVDGGIDAVGRFDLSVTFAPD